MSATQKTPVFILASLLLLPAFAQAVVFDGYLADSSGNPMTGAQTINLKVRSPGAENCILFEENHSVTLGSDGHVSLTVGTGTRIDGLGHTVARAFQNTGTFSGLTCDSSTSYSPASGDKRKLFVKIASEELGYIDVNPTSIAMSSENVGGFTSNNLLRVESSGVPQSATAFTPAQFTELNALLAGTSTRYMLSSGTSGAKLPMVSGTPSSPTAGTVWYDSVSNQMKYYDGTTTQTVSGGGGTITSVTGSAPLSVTGSSSVTVSMPAATAGTNGYLTSADWNNFNNKMSNSLPNGQLWIGNGSNVATAVSMSGDVSVSPTGISTVNGINGRQVFASSPTAGQVLKYNGSFWTSQGLDATDLQSGTLDITRGGTGSTTFTGSAVITSNMTGTALQSLNCPPNQVVKFDMSGYAICGEALMVGGQPATSELFIGTSSGSNFGVRVKVNGAEKMTISNSGNVGINNTSPGAKLHVNGAIVSQEFMTSGTAVDFSMGNTVILSTVSAAGITTSGMIPGGHYTLIIEDTTSRTYSFTGQCSSTSYRPTNAATTGRSIYEFIFRGSGQCYIKWDTGY